MMLGYSPFQKQLKELKSGDLIVLKEVSEGWYIEYKRDIPNTLSIAKSISAFANTYGGWLFFGVEQESNANPVAGGFPGIRRDAVDSCLQRLRQAVSEHLSPAAHFDVAVVWGEPGSELPEGNAIICLHVPWSANAPHIHRRGLIYRRVGDGSEPKPENDRHVLDQMRSRSDRLRSNYSAWVQRDPDFLDSESGTPFLRLLLVADLWRDRDLWCDMTLDQIRQIMNSEEGLSFDNVYTSAAGFIARQTVGNSPRNLTLVWRMNRCLSGEILIPLNKYEFEDREELWVNFEGFEHHKRFTSILEAQGYDYAEVIDLNYLFHVLLGVASTYERLLGHVGWSDSIYAKARLLSVWRTTPFLDIDAVLDQFELHGVPICLDRAVEIFPGTDPETFFEVPAFEDAEGGDTTRIALKALSLFRPIVSALGVPSWLEFPNNSERNFYTELLAAGTRAMEAQKRRNERKLYPCRE